MGPLNISGLDHQLQLPMGLPLLGEMPPKRAEGPVAGVVDGLEPRSGGGMHHEPLDAACTA